MSVDRRAFLQLLGGTAAGSAIATTVGCGSVAARPGQRFDEGIAQALTTQDGLTITPGAAAGDEAYWTRIAAEFPLREGLAYMNTGTRGPSPRSVQRAYFETQTALDSDYQRHTHDVFGNAQRTEIRAKVAQIVGAQQHEIAFTTNTTEAVFFAVLGAHLPERSELLYTNHDHSAGGFPVLVRAERDNMSAGVVDLSSAALHPPRNPSAIVDTFAAALTPQTKLLSFCHINYTDGCVLPVKEICRMARERGIITVVDGAQAPGMMKVDVHDLGCDMYAAATHKWLLASMPAGFLFVREEMIERLRPLVCVAPVNGRGMYGPLSAESLSAFASRRPGVTRFEERNSVNLTAMAGIGAGIDFHRRIGVEAIEARVRYLAARLRTGLARIDGVHVPSSDHPELSSALVPFKIDGIPTARVSDLLYERDNIYTRAITHPEIGWDVNRASLHIMVTASHVDRLIAAIETISRDRARS